MPHIALPESQPGIRGAMAFRPETARPLNDLVEVLLRGPNSLSLDAIQEFRVDTSTYSANEGQCVALVWEISSKHMRAYWSRASVRLHRKVVNLGWSW